MPVVVVAAASVVALAALMAATALVSRRVGRVSVVDVAWGLGFVLVALVAAVTGTVLGAGDPVRRWLVLLLVAVWGLRLAWHIQRRARGAHGGREDPRYAEMLGDAGFGAVVLRVFVVQGLAIAVISAPVQAGSVLPVRSWVVASLGVVVWMLGVVFEAVGDAQLAAYKSDPDRGPVMDRGLWAWTRHPNYFGDACVWWGLWLVGAGATGWLAAAVTLPAPILMTHFLRNVSGARLLERSMSSREGWAEYAARTPYFVPRPPRRSPTHRPG